MQRLSPIRLVVLTLLTVLLTAGCGSKPAPAPPPPKVETAPDSVPGFLYALSINGTKLTLWRMRPSGAELTQLATGLPTITRMLPAKGFVLADTKDGFVRITASGVETLKLPAVQWRGILEDEPDRAYVVAGNDLYVVAATGEPQRAGIKVNHVFSGYEYSIVLEDQADKTVVYLLKAGLNGKPQELVSAAKNGHWVLSSNLLEHGQKYAVLVRGEPSGAYASYVIDLAARKATTVAGVFISQFDESRALAFQPFQNKPGRIIALAAPADAGKPLDGGNALWTSLDKAAFDVNYGPYTGLAGMTIWGDNGKDPMTSYGFFPDQEKVVRMSDGIPQGDALWKSRIGSSVLQVHVLANGSMEVQADTATSTAPVTLPSGLSVAGDNSLQAAKTGFVGLFKNGATTEVGLISPTGYVAVGPDAQQLQVGFDPTGDYLDLLYATSKLPSTLYVVRASDGKAWTVMKNAVLAAWESF